MALNPFSPRAGTPPPYLIGRQTELEQIGDGLDNPILGPEGNILVVGLRGVGKTVLLNTGAQMARERNWLVVPAYLSDSGLLERVHKKLDTLILAHSKSVRPKKMSLGAFGISGELEFHAKANPNATLDDKFAAVLAASHAPGILITVDEAHATSGDAQQQLRELGAEIQLAHGQSLPVIAITAGLPGGIKALLADRDTNNNRTAATFLRRSTHVPVGFVDTAEVLIGFENAIIDTGRSIDDAALDLMSTAVHGYPYLFQLIGHNVFKRQANHISIQDVRQGVNSARRNLGSFVLDVALNDLSSQDKTFLAALASLDGPAQMRDIRELMGVSRQHANAYRERLLDAEMIRQTDRGKVDFTLPYMRDRLREHHVTETLTTWDE